MFCERQTVEGSSNFVDDIRRLRKAGGLRYDRDAGSAAWGQTTRVASEKAIAGTASWTEVSIRRGGDDGPSRAVAGKDELLAGFAAAPVCSAGEIEPLALARELGVQTIVDRVTQAIVGEGRTTETGGETSGRPAAATTAAPAARAGGGRQGHGGLGASLALAYGTTASFGAYDEDRSRSRSPSPLPANQGTNMQLAVTERHRGSGAARLFPSSPPPPGGGSNRLRRSKEDIERLRRVVRDTISSPHLQPSSSSSTSPYGGVASGGGEHCGEHPCVWCFSLCFSFEVARRPPHGCSYEDGRVYTVSSEV